MTICVAALCGDGKSVVLAADRQITMPSFGFEFEHAESKIRPLASSLVMISGGTDLGFEVVERTRLALGGGTHTVQEVAESLRNIYMRVHLERAERVILHPYGFSWQEFKDHAPSIPAAHHQAIVGALANFGLYAVDLLVCGIDATGSHIFRVFYGGVQGGDWMEWCDGTGFRAVGTGSAYAVVSLALARQSRDCSLLKTLYNIYAAKRDAESAPGVGPATDLYLVRSAGTHEVVNDDRVKRLSKLWEKKRVDRQAQQEEIEALN